MYNRINSWTIFFIIAVCALMQATAFDYISILGAKPDLLFILVVFFSLFASGSESVKAAIAAGLIKDITSSSLFGAHTASFLAAALILNYNQTKFFKEKISMQILISVFFFLFMNLSVLWFNSVSKTIYAPYHTFLAVIFKSAIYTGVVTPLCFFILSRLLRRIAKMVPGTIF